MNSDSFWLEYSWLSEGEVQSGVLVEIVDGRIQAVTNGIDTPPSGADVLRGFTIPGLANAHSHCFHRALRGRTEGRASEPSTFWDWRHQMYEIAASIDPDQFQRLARATFAEMALAGITLVGEFHYLHHDLDGSPYSDANLMGDAIATAAADAGIRLTLLDTCYLHGGLESDGYGQPSAIQRRFTDPDAAAWAERVLGLRPTERMRVGAAVHSVRSVDPLSIATVAQWANERSAPLHAHVSEQPVENAQCLAAHGMTPTMVLSEAGAVGPAFTAVHGTHLSPVDLGLLGRAEASVCLCPTTERDLADGVGDATAMAASGIALTVGSDSQSVIDLLEEARAIELDQRLGSLQRGHHSPTELLRAATAGGYRSLGWPEGGQIAVGAPADLTTLNLDNPRLAGQRREDLVAGTVFAATAADVDHVLVAGEPVVVEGRHVRIDVSAELREALK